IGNSEILLASTLTSAKAFNVNAILQFDTGGFNAVLSGPISGTSSLIKTGAGTLTLSGTNSLGTTFLDQGTIAVANAAALGSGNLAVNGGTLQPLATFTASTNLGVQ